MCAYLRTAPKRETAIPIVFLYHTNLICKSHCFLSQSPPGDSMATFCHSVSLLSQGVQLYFTRCLPFIHVCVYPEKKMVLPLHFNHGLLKGDTALPSCIACAFLFISYSCSLFYPICYMTCIPSFLCLIDSFLVFFIGPRGIRQALPIHSFSRQWKNNCKVQ